MIDSMRFYLLTLIIIINMNLLIGIFWDIIVLLMINIYYIVNWFYWWIKFNFIWFIDDVILYYEVIVKFYLNVFMDRILYSHLNFSKFQEYVWCCDHFIYHGILFEDITSRGIFHILYIRTRICFYVLCSSIKYLFCQVVRECVRTSFLVCGG
jgi:hypothetical protein